MHKRGTTENKLKATFQVALKLHLLIHLSMHNSITNDSGKREVRYAALEGASKISFYGALKTAQKVNFILASAIESAPEGTLKLQRSMH